MPTNAAALSRLILLEQRPLRRMFSRLVHRDNLEDALQNLWIRIQRVRDDPPIANKQAFLYYLARNVALDQGRVEARYKRLSAEIESGVWGADFVQPLDEVAIAKDEYTRVVATADAMPEPRRTAFYLNRIDNVPQCVIAERLGISRTMVEKHIRTAIRRLRIVIDRRDK